MFEQDDLRLALAPAMATAVLCGGFTAMCGISHSALGVVFGGIVAVTLALPPLVNSSDRLIDSLIVSLAGVLSVMIVWLFIAITWPQWLACAVVLTAYSGALTCTALSLSRLGSHAVVSAVIVVVIALAWLSWPVWLSPYIAGRETLVNDLVFAQPLLAVNGELIDQGIWTERPQMYAWTALNQDVSYSMPMSVFWCVVTHAGIAGAGAAAIMAMSGYRRRGSRASRLNLDRRP